MSIYPSYNPRLSKADIQERLDIQEGRKPDNMAINMREQKASTQVCGEVTFIAREKSPKVKIQ